MVQERGFIAFHSSSQCCRKFPTPGERAARVTGFIQAPALFVRRHTHRSSPLASPSVPHCPALLPTRSKSFFDGFPSNLSTAGMGMTHAHTRAPWHHLHHTNPHTLNMCSLSVTYTHDICINWVIYSVQFSSLSWQTDWWMVAIL